MQNDENVAQVQPTIDIKSTDSGVSITATTQPYMWSRWQVCLNIQFITAVKPAHVITRVKSLTHDIWTTQQRLGPNVMVYFLLTFFLYFTSLCINWCIAETKAQILARRHYIWEKSG